MDLLTKNRLLTSMAAGRLVVLCGAGLSMAPPSRLPSAESVANLCFDKYSLLSEEPPDPNLRDSLENLAELFVDDGTFDTYFLDQLVPWTKFIKPPNPGHSALADFLITGTVASVMSSNYDTLVERKAHQYGADLQASLDGDEATRSQIHHSPLLKFHGCATVDRKSTVWALSQLDTPTISDRIEKSKIWMAANLREKDFLVVGFWSDWAYLNSVLGDALTDVRPNTITLVDPSPLAELEEKAPGLWELTRKEDVTFCHVQRSGSEVLDELRVAFSKNYLKGMLAAGKDSFEAECGNNYDIDILRIGDFDSEELYNFRRDAEGSNRTEPAKRKQVDGVEMLGYFHLRLRHLGAIETAFGYQYDEKTIRVINGHGQFLTSMKDKFEMPPSVNVDIIVAVGAMDFPVKSNVVRGDRPGSVVRHGYKGNWMTMQDAIGELGI